MRRAVDWRAVEAELARLPDDYKRASFDSLPHVVSVLRALDSTQALIDLNEQRERVQRLVDDIVKGYHGGFNKSIRNYSEILRLFTEAQGQVKAIRASLVASKKELGLSAEALRKQWRRSGEIRETVRVLDDVARAAEAPARATSLCAAGRFEEAAATVVDAQSKLDDDEFGQVRALAESAAAVRDTRQHVRDAIYDGIFAYAYDDPGGGGPSKSSHTRSNLNELVKSACLLDAPDRVCAAVADGCGSRATALVLSRFGARRSGPSTPNVRELASLLSRTLERHVELARLLSFLGHDMASAGRPFVRGVWAEISGALRDAATLASAPAAPAAPPTNGPGASRASEPSAAASAVPFSFTYFPAEEGGVWGRGEGEDSDAVTADVPAVRDGQALADTVRTAFGAEGLERALDSAASHLEELLSG